MVLPGDGQVEESPRGQLRALRSSDVRWGAVGDVIHTHEAEARDPELEAAFREAGVLENEFATHPAMEQVHGFEPFACLPVRAAVDGQLKLLERAGFWVRELTGAADVSGKLCLSRSSEQKPGFYEKTFEKQSTRLAGYASLRRVTEELCKYEVDR